jgi:hypothetical protein
MPLMMLGKFLRTKSQTLRRGMFQVKQAEPHSRKSIDSQ